MYRTSFLINGINFISRILLRLYLLQKSLLCSVVMRSHKLHRPQSKTSQSTNIKGGYFSVLLSTLFHLPPLRYHCVGGCCDLGQLRLQHWLSDALTTRLDLIHSRVDLIHSRLDLIYSWLDLICTRRDLIHTRLHPIHTRLDLILTRLDLIHTQLDLIHNRLDLIHTRLDLIHTRLDLIHSRLDLIYMYSWLDLIHKHVHFLMPPSKGQ